MEPKLLSFDIPDAAHAATTHRLAYTQWGDERAPRTLVCVHGLTRNGRDFDFLAKKLAGEYRIICPDMPGCGRSEWLQDPAGYSYPTYVSSVLYLLKQLHLTQVDWLGTSMGGIIGMMLANAAPGVI